MKTDSAPFAKRIWWAVRPLWYWRLIRLFLRSFWIAIAVGVVGWQISLANNWQLSVVVWGAVSYAAFMVLFPTSLMWPIPASRLARRLDAVFGLRDRISTAHEIASRAPNNYLEQRLIASSERVLRVIRSRLARQNHMPWSDLALSVIAMALLVAVYLGSTTVDAPPPLAAAPIQPPALPVLATEEPMALPGAQEDPALETPTDSANGGGPDASESQNVQGEAVDPAAAQDALQALTEALSEQSITQSAAADLAQGDAGAAAERLRQLADQADELDAEARQALADSLQGAADETRGSAPGVADQIEEAAQAIAPDEGDPAESAAEAAAGLEDLANLVEALNQSRSASADAGAGGAGGEGAGDNQGANVNRESQSSGTTERMQSEGEAVELSAEQAPEDAQSVLQPPAHSGPPTDAVNIPFTQTEARGTGGDLPADPLSFPWRLRRVIQRYFSPR